MADFELHADYDRDGRLTADASEYALRMRAPGAILVPNLDVDSRALPSTVTPAPRLTLDGARPVALAGDDEQLAVLIRINGSIPPLHRLFLRPVGFSKIRLRVNDTRGRQLPRDLARGDDLPILVPPKTTELRFTLSINSLPGAPYGRVTDLNPLYSASGNDESSLWLQLVLVDPGNGETVVDQGQFSIAPFVVLAHDAPAWRVYVADDGNNAATLRELEPALQALGVPLFRVPPLPKPGETAATNDTWLQDQFQPALMQGAAGWRHVMLHLPRNRANTDVSATAANLARFVVSHFPSRNVGLFDDLWQRDLHIIDLNGKQQELGFLQCMALAAEFERPQQLLRQWFDAVNGLQDQAVLALARDWPMTLTARLTALTQLDGVMNRLPPLPSNASAEAQDLRRRGVKAFRDAYQDLVMRFLYAGPQSPFVQLALDKSPVRVTPDDANRIERRLTQMRHSANYGGNIEATPPTTGAPLGKLLIGNAVLRTDPGTPAEVTFDFMDPDLLHLLAQQRRQPIVAVDTTWLHVGHVDEILSVVPETSGAVGFALLRASPGLAMELLERARARYLAGLSASDRARWVDEPSGVLDRRMDKGTSPVTRLLRGKTWLHRHAVVAPGQSADVLEPPSIYQRLSNVMNGTDFHRATGGGVSVHDMRYWPGPGPERHYPADITVSECLYCEKDGRDSSTNRGLGAPKTSRNALIDQILAQQLRGARLLPLPVLFDRVGDIQISGFQTSAFTPNVVNMIVLGKTLLIPRPYGPRMRPEDARVVIAESMAALELPASIGQRVNAGFQKRHGLGQGIYWIERQPRIDRPVPLPGPPTVGEMTTPVFGGLWTQEDVIAQFRDSFPDADDKALKKAIIDSNKNEFDAQGNLKDGPRRLVINDGFVDLFEASILAVTDELGLTVVWVDSWFYHLRYGEIHCGTNVLRAPPTDKRLPKVWSVPATFQGPHGIEMQEFDFTK